MYDRTDESLPLYRVSLSAFLRTADPEAAARALGAASDLYSELDRLGGEVCVEDVPPALIETADGELVDSPEICGHEHVGIPVLYYDGAFRTEVVVN